MAQNGARTKATEVSRVKLLTPALLLAITPCALGAQRAALTTTDSLRPRRPNFSKPRGL